MKHLFKEHKISLHGYMLVKIATIAYVVGRNYVLIFVSLSRTNKTRKWFVVAHDN